jgi:hypothetical protein
MNKKAANVAKRRAPRKARIIEELQPRLMSEAEAAFLRDVQAFIEFAIRNGLTFQATLNPLLSDLNEIVRDGSDLAKGLSRGFQPKVSKYAHITSEDFGESEEES